MGAGGAYGKLGMIGKKGALLAGCRFRSSRTGNEGRMRRVQFTSDLLPHVLQACGDSAWMSVRAFREDGRQPCHRLGGARFGMLAGFEYKEGAEGAGGESTGWAPGPHPPKFIFPGT